MNKKSVKAIDVIKGLIDKDAEKEIRSLKVKVNLMRRQRDAARGRAAEYRVAAIRYQRELAAARRELKEYL